MQIQDQRNILIQVFITIGQVDNIKPLMSIMGEIEVFIGTAFTAAVG